MIALRVPKSWGAAIAAATGATPELAGDDQVEVVLELDGDVTVGVDTPLGRLALGVGPDELLVDGPDVPIRLAAMAMRAPSSPAGVGVRTLRLAIGPDWRTVTVPRVGKVSFRSV